MCCDPCKLADRAKEQNEQAQRHKRFEYVNAFHASILAKAAISDHELSGWGLVGRNRTSQSGVVRQVSCVAFARSVNLSLVCGIPHECAFRLATTRKPNAACD